MKILLLCSAFNGLSQRAWIELSASGHDVVVRLSSDADAMRSAATRNDPDIIICPFLRERVPHKVWAQFRTIIVHPGPPGDRGPSSLDWAISEAAPAWGVTALQAVEEMDGGPIWAYRTFTMPVEPPRKSTLYNGAVTEAAIDVIHEVVRKAGDPAFVPTPFAGIRSSVRGRLRPRMCQTDRAFAWSDETNTIVRRIRAADGSPGVRTELCGVELFVFDARPGPALTEPGCPGTVERCRHGAVLVRTGDGSVWIGHARRAENIGTANVKLRAALCLADQLALEVADQPADDPAPSPRTMHAPGVEDGSECDHEISYRRTRDVGILRFDFYNGAMSTAQCRRLETALRCAVLQDTRVLVVEGGDTFSNGIHLNVIGVSDEPALEAWRNINAIDDVCEQVITCTSQLIIMSVGGNAGAGGVMLALGADQVLVRDGVVLNPHYRTMGLFGSEYWTYVLPTRVGECEAVRLTQQCLPVGADQAVAMGLADAVLPGCLAEFNRSVVDHAGRLAACDDYEYLLDEKRRRRAAHERRRPIATYRASELAEMNLDMFDDRNGFDGARRQFVTKQRPASTPAHLVAPSSGHRPAADLARTHLADGAADIREAIGSRPWGTLHELLGPARDTFRRWA